MSKPTGKSGVDSADSNSSGSSAPENSTTSSISASPDTVEVIQNESATLPGSDSDKAEATKSTGEFGTAVPYSGNDQTEDVEPIALGASFPDGDEEGKKRRKGAEEAIREEDQVRPLEDMHTPERKLVLNDLFDSAPPEGGGLSLTPPNPTAFWSSKPPPPRPASKSAGPEPLFSEPLFSEPLSPELPPPAVAAPQKAPEPKVPATSSDAKTPVPETPPAVPSAEKALTGSEPFAGQFDELQVSVEETIPLDLQKGPSPLIGGGATIPRAASPSRPPRAPSQDQAVSTLAESTQDLSNPLVPETTKAAEVDEEFPVTPSASTPTPAGRASAITMQSAPSARRTAADGAAKTASPSSPPEPKPELQPPAANQLPAVEDATAPNPTQAQTSLPSVVVAEKKRALTPDDLKLKAARASKATMIIELPAGFNQPGGPTAAMLEAVTTNRPLNQSSPAEVTIAPPEKPKNGLWLAAALMFALAALITGYRFMSPSTGTLVVTAQGPGGAPVAGVSITIQGLTCGTSPCIISKIQPGTHLVSVRGTEVEPDDSQILIEAGKEFVHNVLLRPLGTPKGNGGRAGSIHLEAADQDLVLFLDRNRIGQLPQTVSALAPGRHWLELKTSRGEDEVSRWVTVKPGEQLEVAPEPVESPLGSVRIQLNSSSRGAAVTLDDAFLLDFPTDVELEPGVVHRLSASKSGYRTFKTEFEVTAGQERELIEIDLRRSSSRRKSSKKKAKKKKKKKKSRKKSKRPAGDPTMGSLTLRSTPASNVILNGRPIGKTPKVGISVPGDTLQTVVFVHPDKGRRRAQKYVKAGESQTVSVQF